MAATRKATTTKGKGGKAAKAPAVKKKIAKAEPKKKAAAAVGSVVEIERCSS